MAKEECGKVKSVYFGKEDDGILTLNIGIDFGVGCQNFGGYALDTYDHEKKRRIGTAAGTDMILRLLNLFEVDALDKMKGRTVIALRDSDAWIAPIVGLKMPAFDGGKELRISDWSAQWFNGKD